MRLKKYKKKKEIGNTENELSTFCIIEMRLLF